MKFTRKPNKSIVLRNRLTGYAFLLPNLIGFFIFTFIPVFIALGLSFMKWDSANAAEFIAFDNFKMMFKDSGFRISFLNTVYYTFAVVPLTVIVALMLAVVLNRGLKGVVVLRAIHFFPHIASFVAVAVVWQFLYNPDMGPINGFLRMIGIQDPPRWIASEKWAMPAVIFMSVWKSAGYYMVMLLAGLQAIPSHFYEAATIDGASPWQKFRNITIPMLSPTMFFVIIICLINSFKVFDQVYIMTKGGPGRATSVLVYYIYQQGFINSKFGYASAMALVLFMVTLIITIIQFRGQGKWVSYLN